MDLEIGKEVYIITGQGMIDFVRIKEIDFINKQIKYIDDYWNKYGIDTADFCQIDGHPEREKMINS